MRMRRLLSLLITFALLLGSAVPTLAAGRGKGSWFRDVPEDDWSLPYVLEMQAKGLMQGMGDGLFQPGGPLTRAQAVTVAVRLMGLEEEARDLDDDEVEDLLPFTDRDDIPEWARPYIAVAVDHDIMPVAEDGLLRADENATRLWVSVLLVRALGYEAEAQAKMKADLPFRDADLIPASLVGYVAAAVDHELVEGFPDRTFRPNQPLTRAQAAALLSRTDRQLGELGRFRPGFLVGDLVRVSERDDTLTLSVQGRQRTLEVDPDAIIFLDDRRADLDDLPEDARVSMVLDSNDTVLLIIARSPVSAPDTSGVKGEISAIFLPSEMAGGLGLIVLETSGGRERTFPLAPQVTASYDGRSLDLEDLQLGDQVTVQVIAGVAISIEVTRRSDQRPDEREDEIKGVVTGVYPYSISFLGSLDVRVGSRTRTITVAPGAVITSDGNRIDLADLEEGDRVTIRLAGGVAIRIVVDEPARREETLRGEIRTIYPATRNSRARIAVKTDDGTRTVTLASNVVIRYGGSRLTVGDLRVGDEVTVHLVNGAADEIRVEDRAPLAEEVKGTIEAIEPATRSTGARVTVKTTKGSKTITLASDASIRHGSSRLRVEDLRLGDRVAIKVVDGIGTEIKVEARGPLIEEVRGTVEEIQFATRSARARVTVRTDSGSKTVTLANDVSIRHGQTQLRLGDLRVGDRVSIRVVDGVGAEIKVEDRGPLVEQVRGTIEAVYAVSITFQSSIEVRTGKETRTITLAPDVAIRHGRNSLKLADLRKGDEVTVTVVNGIGAEIVVEKRGAAVEEVEGVIEAVYPVSISFQPSIDVRTDSGIRRITLAGDVAIRHGQNRLSAGDLRKGDRVTVTIVNEIGTEIEVHDRGPLVVEVRGTIEAVYEFSINFQPSIDVRTEGGVRNILLAPDVVIRRGQAQLSVGDLRKGDRVTVSVVNEVGTAIQVEETQAEELTGQLLAVYQVSISFQPSLLIKTGEGSRTVLLGPETVYTRGRTQLRLGDLEVGDRVRVKLVGGVAETVNVEESPRTSALEGTIIGIFERDITVRTESRRERTLTLAEEAPLTYKGKRIGIDELLTGDRVDLMVRGDVIIQLEVERRSSGLDD